MIQRHRTLQLVFLLVIAFCILTGTASAATEKITNGGFSSSLTGWTITPDGATVMVKTGGASGNYADFYGSTSAGTPANVYMSQSVDLTGVDTLTFQLKLFDVGSSINSNAKRFYVSIGGTQVASYAPTEMSTSWGSKTIDVSAYTGYNDIEFHLNVYSGYGSDIVCQVGLDQVSALAYTTPPTVTSVTANNNNAVLTGSTTTASIAFTRGDTSTSSFIVNWGDGTSVQELSSTSSPLTATHTYSSPGTYTITAYGILRVGSYSYTSDPVTTTATVISADFTASPVQGPAPLTVTYTADVSNANSLLWNFGDGGTSTYAQTQHTYSSNGYYTVTLTATAADGKSVTITKEDLITVADEYVRWSQSSYTAGDTATISWELINPSFSTQTYTLRVYAADAGGYPTGDPVRTPASITTASGSTTIDTTGLAGNYIAVVAINGVNTDLYAAATVVSVATLTVNIALDAVVYTNETTVTVQKDGTTVSSQTTITGTVSFTLPTGTYTVIATTMGYNQQTTTVTLTDATTISMDFIRGSSEGSSSGGSGVAYASSFVTIRVLDDLTGVPVQGATVYAVGKAATNPVSWMSQLFGGSWGENIIDTELSGVTDANGAVTFAMFPNVRYEITTSYQSITQITSLQPSALTGEYLIRLEVTAKPDKDAAVAVQTNVSIANNTITVQYADSSRTTTRIQFSLAEQGIDGNYTVIQTREVISQTASESFLIDDPAGKSYRITITAQTTQYGTITRDYGTTFPGPLVDIGIPSGLYIYLCLGALLLFAAAGTIITGPMIGVCVCFMGWILYFMGWMFALGAIAPVALSMATILSILFYIRTRGAGDGMV